MSYRFPDARIAMFAREPVPGRVKTRLCAVLGEEGACKLYRSLLAHQMAWLGEYSGCEAELWVDRNPGHGAFAGFAGNILLQQGHDLGARMEYAFESLLQGASCALLIGSDCPGMDGAYLDLALTELAGGADVVIGPAADGGYVLIGMRQVCPDLFRAMPWGSDRVLEQTRQRLLTNHLQAAILPELEDIDRPGDLELLAEFGIFPEFSRFLIS